MKIQELLADDYDYSVITKQTSSFLGGTKYRQADIVKQLAYSWGKLWSTKLSEFKLMDRQQLRYEKPKFGQENYLRTMS